ncbi:GNAT family N-acetyltransferase family protein [Rubrobacter aplysinae]|uniref:hypothetical protein n=1 Tax=Rubrobacter aplysinae TaxID=909625 RepID=UPI00064B8287|nr:hypothetical protein [Rubrobacter aplysinae]
MKTVIRQLGPEESREGVSRLRAISYPELSGIRGSGLYEAMYLRYQHHPLGERVERWISVTGDGEVVGHLAALPLYYRINGRRVVAYTPGDYMVHPEHGFQALSLMRRFFGSVDNCFSCDRLPAVISTESRLGAEVAGQMQYAVKLLNVSRLPVPAVSERLKRAVGLPRHATLAPGDAPQSDDTGSIPLETPRKPLPAPVKSLLNRALAGVDHRLLKDYGKGYRVEEAEGFDTAFDELFEKVASVVPCVPEKDAAFLQWRYGPGSPQSPVKVLCVRDARGLLGYAVVKVTLEGEDAYILDLTVLPGYTSVARALLRESVRYFRDQGAHIVRYRYLESPTTPRGKDLGRLGFFSRSVERRDSVLVRFEDPARHEVASDLGNWSYNIGDGEATFWMR